MELFRQLGAELEETWRAEDYNETVFPKIAADGLRRADLPSKVTAWDVIEWTLRQSELPPQKDPAANFGDPPITLFVAPRFYIDVYFWLNGTTQIHQHSFCGAFQVLHGSSLHSWYEFDARARVNVFTEIGDMTLKVCELLKVGDVQEILAGRQYIHSLFHLDQPSATIVVRTEKSPLYLPQYSYHKPSLALDPFYEHQTTVRKLQSLGPLFQINHPDTDRLVADMLETSDFQSSFAILSAAHDHLSGGFLGLLFKLNEPAERFRKFLEIVQRRHGSKAADLPAIFEHRERVGEIVRRRSYVTDPEQRFFFAVLMNVEGRERVFSLIRQRFLGSEPIEKVLDLVHDLSHTRVVGVNAPNALGLEDFGDVDMSILENLLHGRSATDTLDAVRAEYGDDRLDGVDVEAKLARITGSSIFRPLLVE